MPTYDRVKLGIGYVPQGREIFPQMTVQENLELGLKARGGGKVPEYIYDLFPILPAFARRNGGDLSGGQQQRLCIARALAIEPEVILMDEPTSALDPISTSRIEDLVLELKDKYTIVMVTHSVKAASTAGRVLFIRDGEVFHQIYRGNDTDEQLYQKISDTLTLLATGGDRR